MEVTLSAAQDAASRFAIQGTVREVSERPGGKIHASFVVTAGSRRYFLQCMNTQVFARPELVMENVAAVTAHLAASGERTPAIVGTREGGTLWRGEDGTSWRMFEFFDRAVTMEWLNEGQRIQDYTIDAWQNGAWKPLIHAHAIGHKKIDIFTPVTAQRVRLNLLSTTGEAHIREFQLFADNTK